MDDLEKNIINIVSKKISTPSSYEKAIRTAFESKTHTIKATALKTIITSCAGIIITSGIVFAGYNAYEKIWKEPRQYDVFKEKSEETIDSEKNNVISEHTISNNAKEVLVKLGYPNEEVKKINLKINYEEGNNTYYDAITEEEYHNKERNIGIYMCFNSKTGDLEYFLNNDFKYSDILKKLENVVQDKAEEEAKLILNSIGYSVNDYQIQRSKKIDGNEWQIIFAKNYNGIFNRYDSLEVNFGIVNGKCVVESVYKIMQGRFENNEFMISEEEAISIAKSKEIQFSGQQITNITAKKSIEKMNTFIYNIENNIEDGTSIKIDDPKVRNVWVIKVEHEKEPKDADKMASGIEYVKKFYDKKYFIDATTGEIIGGEQARFSLGLEQ